MLPCYCALFRCTQPAGICQMGTSNAMQEMLASMLHTSDLFLSGLWLRGEGYASIERCKASRQKSHLHLDREWASSPLPGATDLASIRQPAALLDIMSPHVTHMRCTHQVRTSTASLERCSLWSDMSGIAVAQQTYSAESFAFPHSPVKRVSTSLCA
jgi:hypothetical protein